jgi:nucleoside-diphosphate-sugar epimerase
MILVTGATGLVGGHLLWHLLQKHEQIVALKRKTSNLTPLRTIFRFYTDEPDAWLNKIEWRDANILDMVSLRDAMQGITLVYHCAAVVSLGKGDDTLMDTNVLGTRNVVSVALENKTTKLCFVSSIAACGFADHGEMITEETPWEKSNHKSLYAISKYKAEQEVWKAIQNGLHAVIVNPGVILGVSGINSGSSMIFEQSRKGMLFYTLGGSGYVDVQDVVKAMIQLMESNISGERFILVSENNSNKDILTLMAKGFKKPRPFINVNKSFLTLAGLLVESAGKIFGFKPVIDRSFAVSATNRSYYSAQKIKNALDYRFKPISQCIQEVCAFMLKR